MKERWVGVVGTLLQAAMAVCIAVGLYALWRNAHGVDRGLLGLSTGSSLLFIVCMGADRYLEKRFGWKAPLALRAGIIAACVVMLAVFCAAMWGR